MAVLAPHIMSAIMWPCLHVVVKLSPGNNSALSSATRCWPYRWQLVFYSHVVVTLTLYCCCCCCYIFGLLGSSSRCFTIPFTWGGGVALSRFISPLWGFPALPPWFRRHEHRGWRLVHARLLTARGRRWWGVSCCLSFPVWSDPLAGVLVHSLCALTAANVAAPVKFTFALVGLLDSHGVVSSATTHHVTTIGTLGCLVAKTTGCTQRSCKV